MRAAVSCLLFLGVVAWRGPAFAARYALIAANNRGWASEVPLQFAHNDATRLATILKELGGFKGHNLVILKDATPQAIESGLKRLSARMHAKPDPMGQDLLFFYYSGHADEKALHPGVSSLSYEKLKQLIQQVPGAVRIALLDSCKSGALTKIKGAKAGPSFEVKLASSGKVTGDVFITSAAFSENAQESKRLQGSFFTNYVTSGLRGAADANDDGIVTLGELYAYAYVMTVGRTTGTRSGTQHPSYRFDLQGRGELILSRPGKATACLVFGKGPRANQCEILNARTDAIIAEVPPSPLGTTRIALRPGYYKIRRRKPEGVYEQEIRLLASECRRITDSQMKRIILPETLTKGELLSETWSAGVGYVASIVKLDEAVPLHRVTVSLRIPIAQWAIRPHLQHGQTRYQGKILGINTKLWSGGVSVSRDWATIFGLFGVGPLARMLLLRQTLDPLDSRWVAGLLLGVDVTWAIPLPWWHLAIQADVRAGDTMYGFNDGLTHSFTLEASAGFRFWWQGP